ncbi:MAG: AcrR family transcriptional regulator [Flavobacteriaceae bacterium]|jgi:AcrR family transcriptional regulator|uniref:TetR/AcrR family transcriptional regulator n=1 Tax=Candidatus Marifrigoribacter sp. Uisw_064 TaxID=3230970 RepID=UPI003AEEC384
MSIEIKISLNEGLYLKEPQDSKLGRNIIRHSILMIDEYGFESFTFKKLAQEINSTEASIYRYFENKHLLLLFLVNWYWQWVNYLIEINIRNIDDPKRKLQIIIHSFVSASKENPSMDYVNESKLHSIVISEGMKAYHTKEVDKENSKGFFKSYKELAKSVSNVISEINPNFKYPFTLATNLFEMSNNQIYFANHLPKLTDISIKNDEANEVEEMLNYFAERLLA